jgi:hypothetical protein
MKILNFTSEDWKFSGYGSVAGKRSSAVDTRSRSNEGTVMHRKATEATEAGSMLLSFCTVLNGVLRLIVAAALGIMLGVALIHYEDKYGNANSALRSGSSVTDSPSITGQESSISSTLNDGLVAIVDGVSPDYLETLSLPPNSLYVPPYRESTIKIEGIMSYCGIYWSILGVDDTSIKLRGFVDFDSPQEFQVGPLDPGEYSLIAEEKCSRLDALYERALNMAVFVLQESQRALDAD